MTLEPQAALLSSGEPLRTVSPSPTRPDADSTRTSLSLRRDGEQQPREAPRLRWPRVFPGL
jgi:hypothetical protein